MRVLMAPEIFGCKKLLVTLGAGEFAILRWPGRSHLACLDEALEWGRRVPLAEADGTGCCAWWRLSNSFWPIQLTPLAFLMGAARAIKTTCYLFDCD